MSMRKKEVNNMDSEKFVKMVHENANFDYGICPPPIDAQYGLNILIKHFLGPDWYVIMPLCQRQVNTEAVYAILKKYPEKKSFKDIIKNLLTKCTVSKEAELHRRTCVECWLNEEVRRCGNRAGTVPPPKGGKKA